MCCCPEKSTCWSKNTFNHSERNFNRYAESFFIAMNFLHAVIYISEPDTAETKLHTTTVSLQWNSVARFLGSLLSYLCFVNERGTSSGSTEIRPRCFVWHRCFVHSEDSWHGATSNYWTSIQFLLTIFIFSPWFRLYLISTAASAGVIQSQFSANSRKWWHVKENHDSLLCPSSNRENETSSGEWLREIKHTFRQ